MSGLIHRRGLMLFCHRRQGLAKPRWRAGYWRQMIALSYRFP